VQKTQWISLLFEGLPVFGLRVPHDAPTVSDNRFDNRTASPCSLSKLPYVAPGLENTMEFHVFLTGARCRPWMPDDLPERPETIIKEIIRDSWCVIRSAEFARAAASTLGVSDNRFDNRLGRHIGVHCSIVYTFFKGNRVPDVAFWMTNQSARSRLSK